MQTSTLREKSTILNLQSSSLELQMTKLLMKQMRFLSSKIHANTAKLHEAKKFRLDSLSKPIDSKMDLLIFLVKCSSDSA